MNLNCIMPLLTLLLACSTALAQETRIGTEISFRGQLNQAGAPASGQYDFRLRLFDAESAGNLIASRDIPSIAVFDGRYSFPVDFGANAFTGGERWIEVQVQDPNGTGGFQALNRRTEVYVVPYAETAMTVRGGHVRAHQSCASGQVVAGVNAAGNLICVAGGSGGTVNLFARIVSVPGDDTPINNGTALRAAVAFINQQPRDADNRWKIMLEPGTFDLGNQNIVVPRYVSWAGSGQQATLVRGAVAGIMIRIGSDQEFSRMTLRNDVPGEASEKDIFAFGGSNLRFSDLRLIMTGSVIGMNAIQLADGTNRIIDNVEIEQECTGSGSCHPIVVIGGETRITQTAIKVRHSGTSGDNEAIQVLNGARVVLRNIDTDMRGAGGQRGFEASGDSVIDLVGFRTRAESTTNARVESFNIVNSSGSIRDVTILARSSGTAGPPLSSAYGILISESDPNAPRRVDTSNIEIAVEAPADAVAFRSHGYTHIQLLGAKLSSVAGGHAIGLQTCCTAGTYENVPGFQGQIGELVVDVASPAVANGALLYAVNGADEGARFFDWTIRTDSLGSGYGNGVDLKPALGKDIEFSDIRIYNRNAKSADGFRVLKNVAQTNAVVLRRVQSETERVLSASNASNYSGVFHSNVAGDRLRLVIEDSRFRSIAPDPVAPAFTQGVFLRSVDADLRNSQFSSGGSWSLFADCCGAADDAQVIGAASRLRLVGVTAIDDDRGDGAPAFAIHGAARATIVNSYLNGTQNYAGPGGVTGSMECIASTVGDMFFERGACENVSRVPLFP